MTQLILHCKPTPTNGPCSLCGQPTSAPAGTQLVLADSLDPVCPDCGRKHAPALAALVNLAGAAERVGRIGRHTVFPPLTALLDLARAAEDYSCTTTSPPPPPPPPPPCRAGVRPPQQRRRALAPKPPPLRPAPPARAPVTGRRRSPPTAQEVPGLQTRAAAPVPLCGPLPARYPGGLSRPCERPPPGRGPGGTGSLTPPPLMPAAAAARAAPA